jgi:hypothetical protein
VFRTTDDLLACIVISSLFTARRIDIACQSGDLNMKDPFQAMDVVLPNHVCSAITVWPRSIRSADAAVYTLADVQVPIEYAHVS